MFSDNAKWIWTDHATPRFNAFVCFRRSFTLRSAVGASLRITADARYRLFVNGKWIGHGPARAYPQHWQVDTYDLTGLVEGGLNTIAVLVHDIGISTFQYILCRTGLLAELELEKMASIVTDSTWRCRPHKGYTAIVPREAVHRAWEEQFDARRPPGPAWMDRFFDDSDWPKAKPLFRAGEGPHGRLEPRDIPLLNYQPRYPVRLISTDVVESAPCTWSINLKVSLNPDDITSNKLFGRMFLATYIHSPKDQPAQIQMVHSEAFEGWKLNGQKLIFNDRSLQQTKAGLAHVRFKKGWNCLIAKTFDITHIWQNALNLWFNHPVTFHADRNTKTANPWVAVGPFAGVWGEDKNNPHEVRAKFIPPEGSAELYEQIWRRGTLEGLDLPACLLRPLDKHQLPAVDVYAICASDRPVPRACARLENPHALLHDTYEWTTVHASPKGDVRLLLDLGQEVSGFHEIELDAPAGTIVDVENFEHIRPNGRWIRCEGMNNTFRYVCREGAQRFSAFTPRGMRFSLVTFRNHPRPVKVRMVRVLESIYPVSRRASFESSDQLLNDTWSISARTLELCMEDAYIDCPGWERTYWVGDAWMDSRVDLLIHADDRLSRRSWLLAAQSLDTSPLVLCQMPSGWHKLLTSFSMLWMIWGAELFEASGDRRFARQALGWISRNVEGIAANLNKLGLFAVNASNMLDWAPMDTPYEAAVTHVNCLTVWALRKSAWLARQMGQPGRAGRWSDLARAIGRAINRHLWSSKRRAFADCLHPDGKLSDVFSQQTHATALLGGVVSGARARRCLDLLEKPQADYVKPGSPFTATLVLEALANNNRLDRLRELIQNCWGKMLENGATTLWETLVDDPNQPGQAISTRSFCHAWGSGVANFLARHVLGVSPAKPGYIQVRIAPNTLGLSFARGLVPTPAGDVKVSWRNYADSFTLEAEIPAGVKGVIALPCAGQLEVIKGRARRAKGPAHTERISFKGGQIDVVVKKRVAEIHNRFIDR